MVPRGFKITFFKVPGFWDRFSGVIVGWIRAREVSDKEYLLPTIPFK